MEKGLFGKEGVRESRSTECFISHMPLMVA